MHYHLIGVSAVSDGWYLSGTFPARLPVIRLFPKQRPWLGKSTTTWHYLPRGLDTYNKTSKYILLQQKQNLLIHFTSWFSTDWESHSIWVFATLSQTALFRPTFLPVDYRIHNFQLQGLRTMDIEALKEQWSEVEDRDGVRLSWNVFPSSRMVCQTDSTSRGISAHVL